ncbi:lysoplasmalogenase [Faecalibacter rhinopitheci]|uniref:Lysoplasmalogenase n=1 Tax=Faecalibacter rhinopitheci TaxID=2779678 RepID=A0A8J7KA79_9FLAO|nr:lysoplasmalogenase [Faecalibacter rhinopitheci]MBF0597190.1 lysoplasmalogenase [Faecalibacter rhinopitheci]
MLIFLSILILISSIIYLFLRLKKPSLSALIFKIISTFLIIIYTVIIVYSYPENINFGLIIIVGLIFGLIGDIFLDLKTIYPIESDIYTFLGFYSFLIGHFVYIGYFLPSNTLSIMENSLVFAIAGIVVFLVLATETPMKLNYGRFRIITTIYAFILSFVTVLSLWIGLKTSELSYSIFGVGMILFLISDLILSQIYFGRKDKNWMISANYIFYISAQYLIASSIIFK